MRGGSRAHTTPQKSGQSGCTGSSISPSPPGERNPWGDGSAPATESDETCDDDHSFSNQSPQLDSLRSSTESTSGGAAGEPAAVAVAPHPGSGRGSGAFSQQVGEPQQPPAALSPGSLEAGGGPGQARALL